MDGLNGAAVSMGGDDFDWGRPMGAPPASVEAPSEAASSTTLSNVKFELHKGELLGICGEVRGDVNRIMRSMYFGAGS